MKEMIKIRLILIVIALLPAIGCNTMQKQWKEAQWADTELGSSLVKINLLWF
jgi:hypothetical protein